MSSFYIKQRVLLRQLVPEIMSIFEHFLAKFDSIFIVENVAMERERLHRWPNSAKDFLQPKTMLVKGVLTLNLDQQKQFKGLNSTYVRRCLYESAHKLEIRNIIIIKT